MGREREGTQKRKDNINLVISEKSSQTQGTPHCLYSLRRSNTAIHLVMGMTLFARSQYYYYFSPRLLLFLLQCRERHQVRKNYKWKFIIIGYTQTFMQALNTGERLYFNEDVDRKRLCLYLSSISANKNKRNINITIFSHY